MPVAVDILGVTPFVASSAAYVAVIRDSEEPANLIVRTYDAEGVALEDVLTVADPGVETSPFDHACIVRGATEGVLDGSAIAFVLGVRDLYVIDLEALDLVTVATTNRPADADGLTVSVNVRGGTDKFWECGILGGIDAGSSNPDTFELYVRTIGVDGTTIAAVASETGHPRAGESPNDAIDTEGAPIPVGSDSWGVVYRGYDDESSPGNYATKVKTVNEAGSFATVADRAAHDGDSSTDVQIPVGLVIGSSAGSPLNRMSLDVAGPFNYDGGTSRYLGAALFNLTDFTPRSSSVNRDGTVLVWQADGASRICTWDGSHPIGDADDEPGPTFAGDFDGAETLLWLFGL